MIANFTSPANVVCDNFQPMFCFFLSNLMHLKCLENIEKDVWVHVRGMTLNNDGNGNK